MDFEQEAREQGWKPEEEWKGDPPSGGFKSAEQFVKDGEHIPGILKSKLASIEERLEQSLATNAEFKKFTDKQIQRERKEKENAIAELEKVKAQAITDGDGGAVIEAERQIKGLQVEEPESRNGYDELAQNWANENKWYATNDKLGAFADGIAERIVQEGYTGKAYFNELTRRTKEAFPEEFENPKRKTAPAVEDGGNRDTGGGGKTWADLPADAKAAATRFMADIPGYTKEDYLQSYEWD